MTEVEFLPYGRHMGKRISEEPGELRAMKVIILSAVAALVLAYGASFVLGTQQRPDYEAFVGSGARVGDDPGTNLVGPDWDGQNSPKPQS